MTSLMSVTATRCSRTLFVRMGSAACCSAFKNQVTRLHSPSSQLCGLLFLESPPLCLRSSSCELFSTSPSLYGRRSSVSFARASLQVLLRRFSFWYFLGVGEAR